MGGKNPQKWTNPPPGWGFEFDKSLWQGAMHSFNAHAYLETAVISELNGTADMTSVNNAISEFNSMVSAISNAIGYITSNISGMASSGTWQTEYFLYKQLPLLNAL